MDKKLFEEILDVLENCKNCLDKDLSVNIEIDELIEKLINANTNK